MSVGACAACLRRTWLLERLGGYLQYQREELDVVLGLEDQALLDIRLEATRRRGEEEGLAHEHAKWGEREAESARALAGAAGLELICRCEDEYPGRLRRLSGPPAVLHVAGGLRRFLELERDDPVAIVGTRRPTLYGTDVASRLARGVSASGLTVVSGMALGIDAAAHRGALAGGGLTIAVLPAGAGTAYPRSNRQLYEQILSAGVAISELGPGARPHRWTLIARNRIIAALSELTIVVQGRSRSGALTTARLAQRCGSRLGAVPGSVFVPQSEGPHQLLTEGAALIRDPQDALDAVGGVGVRAVPDSAVVALSSDARSVLEAIRRGADTVAALGRAEVAGRELLAALGELELAGCVRRVAGGRYSVIA